MEILTLEEQDNHLAKVSRTFALTIPVLPADLRDYVGNAYLLCRIADTIEDDPVMTHEAKQEHLKNFVACLRQQMDTEKWTTTISALLQTSAKQAEYALMCDIPKVLARYHSYPADVKQVLSKGVAIMCYGMAQAQSMDSVTNIDDVDKYCYSVAGVVGEILVNLFAIHCPKVMQQLPEMMPLSISFGEALQLTNILKDVWDDEARGVYWLPFSDCSSAEKVKITQDYVRIAYGHVKQAIDFITRIPYSESGIRFFCILAIAMAIKTLRNIYNKPDFKNVTEIKITRKDVKRIVIECKIMQHFNCCLRLLFNCYAGSKMQPQIRDAKQLQEKVSFWEKQEFI